MKNNGGIIDEVNKKCLEKKDADYAFCDRLQAKELGQSKNSNVLTVVNIRSSRRTCFRPKGKVVIASA